MGEMAHGRAGDPLRYNTDAVRCWDVVYVFQNGDDERQRDFLRVLVVGVEGTQSIENFEWGPGPLTPPA